MLQLIIGKEGSGLPPHALHANWLRLQQHGQRWLLPLWQRAAALGVERWRRLTIALLAAWILANLARLIWLLLPLSNGATTIVTPINAPAVSTQKIAAADIEKMASWHLFGEVGAQPRAAVVEDQVQETTLNLQLLGVIASSESAQARAFIQADGKQQQFAIGEQLPGSGKVVLNKVLVDRAIIDNNGRYETLWLYDPDNSNRASQPVATDSAATSTVDMRADPRVTAMAQGYRQQLYQNPGNLADVIQVAPAMDNGKLIGYRVNPGRDQAQFLRFGLKPGDVVIGINDVSLDDPQRALELYNLLRSAREATITVHRGNENTVLRVSLDNGGDSDR